MFDIVLNPGDAAEGITTSHPQELPYNYAPRCFISKVNMRWLLSPEKGTSRLCFFNDSLKYSVWKLFFPHLFLLSHFFGPIPWTSCTIGWFYRSGKWPSCSLKGAKAWPCTQGLGSNAWAALNRVAVWAETWLIWEEALTSVSYTMYLKIGLQRWVVSLDVSYTLPCGHVGTVQVKSSNDQNRASFFRRPAFANTVWNPSMWWERAHDSWQAVHN